MHTVNAMTIIIFILYYAMKQQSIQNVTAHTIIVMSPLLLRSKTVSQ